MENSNFLTRLKGAYKSRVTDAEIEKALSLYGAVCVEGPKWCGKTWSSAYHSKSHLLIGSPDGLFADRKLAETSVSSALKGDTPRLIDEWQELPFLWDAVRAEVDARGMKGQFILTGSSTPQRKGVMHSGAGRIGKLKMDTMTLFERGLSSGKISLKSLCEGNGIDCSCDDISLEDLIEMTLCGGWPGLSGMGSEGCLSVVRSYLEMIIDDDVSRVYGRKYSKKKMKAFMLSLARNESTAVSQQTIVKDLSNIDASGIDKDTVSAYADVLERLFLTSNQEAFSDNMRSPIRLKQNAKRHYCDVSIPAALLGASVDGMIRDLNTFGFLFESLCEHDLRAYSRCFDAEIFHYMDYDNNEIDAVLSMRNGDWCAFEIKLGANQIDSAADNLIRISNRIAAKQGVPPKTLCVLCGLTKYAYRRKDGVFVVPITALKP